MTKIFTIFFFTSIVFSVTAQNFKFDDITKAELAITQDGVFPEADAAILHRNILFKYGRALYFSERIKIYKKDGFEYSNFETNFEDIKSLKAYVYNLEGGNIVKTKVDRKNIFKEKNDDRETMKFAFPNVKEGSILEITYKVENIGMRYLYTQAAIPTKKIKIAIQNPGRLGLKVSENPLGKVFLKRFDSDFQILFRGENIPALKEEEYVPNINAYRGKLFIERIWLKSGRQLNTWADVAERHNDYSWFGRELKSSGSYYKDELKRILGNETDTLKRAKIIYYYLQDRMNWDDYYSRGADNIRETFISKKGDTGDINLLLTSMLKKAGIRAHLTPVASKSRGYILFPTFTGFNSLISTVEIGDDMFLLDASRKNATFGLIHQDLMNGDGLVIYEDDSYKLIPTKSDVKSVSTRLIEMSISPEEMIVTGKVKRRITNHFAWEYRNDYGKFDGTSYKKTLEKNALLRVSNFEQKNLNDPQYPIDMSYDFEYEENVEFINDEVYFEPLLFFGISENVFKNEKRLFPIDYEYPFLRNYIINCKIPEGYEVKLLPKAQNITVEDNVGKLKYNINSNDTHIQISFAVEINYALIPSIYYDGLKSLYEEHFRISESKVVLSKITN